MIDNILINKTEELLKNISFDLEKYPHALIVGTTGSGKTYFSKLLLGKISLYVENAELYLCDFKGDTDFSIFENCERCFKYLDTIDGFNEFYNRFEARQNGSERSKTPIFLFFDEWGAFISSLEKKLQDEIKKSLAILLMLGRSFNVHIIISLQRADSIYFINSGSRDNFSIRLALGRLSSEGKRMMFPDNENKEIEPKKQGNGYLLLDGQELVSVIVPRVRNQEKLNMAIRELLDNTYGMALENLH